MDIDEELDATGLLCPLPVLKTAKRLRALPGGAVFRLLTDDPAAVIDVPHFCAQQGHEIVYSTEENGALIYVIRKA